MRLVEGRSSRADIELTGGLDIFNVLNSSDVLAVNTTVGPSWLNPTQVLGGRLFRVSARMDF